MSKKSVLSPDVLLVQQLGGRVPVECIRRVDYTARAFRQDSEQAIRNDPYLAIIEALTNADDSLGNRDGDITIGVDGGSRPWTLSIVDTADGIAPAEIEEKLIKLGSRTSGLEHGKSTRGNRGRGARDLASLGTVMFETIHNGWYSTLLLTSNGDLATGKPARATPDLRGLCGIDKNGTRVTITCRTAKKPQAGTMARRLQSLVALRDIMQNPKRRITLWYGANPPMRLAYVAPRDRKLIGKWTFAVPGYRGRASLTLYQSPKPFDEDPRDIAREGGILIKGGRAVHESTLFDFEGNAAARRLSGELRWDDLDDLIRRYDDEEEQGRNHTDRNPFPIVRRSRDGLDPTHPAYKALKLAARPIISAEVKRLEHEMSRGAVRQSEQTRRRFSALGELLGKFWNSKREEIDDEGGTDSAEHERELEPGLSVAPPRKRIDPGATATFSLRLVSSELIAPQPTATMQLVLAEPPDAVALSCATLQLRGTDEGGLHVYRGSFRVTASDCVGEALVEALCAEKSAALEITVANEMGWTPSALQFEHDTYRLRPGRPKRVRILAPEWLVRSEGEFIELRSSSPNDIEVRKSPVRVKALGNAFVAEATISGDDAGAKAKIYAHLGKVVAAARAVIADAQQPRVEVKIDSIAGNQRAQVRKSDRGDISITINGTHNAAKRYLGEHPTYALQNTVPACVFIADVAGEEMVQFFLTEKFKAREVDPTTLQAQRIRELADLMSKVHLIMLPDRELRRGQPSRSEDSGEVA